MKKLFLLLAVIIAFTLSAVAQTQNVTGVVVSADNGEPLIGATVMGVGTQIGVVTDIDGNFAISVPASTKKLSVSYVGMKTVEAPITKGKMTISLEGSNVLDEVITVAYGTAKRSAFTGSASVLDASKIEAVQVSNPADALSGKVAGVQLTNASGAPGSSPTIRIRGISSINAGNSPLFIVDGAPAADINNISTMDIESMTVLKDAASNALYGARGANGVVLITTKKGKGNARVTFDARLGQNSRATKDYDIITDPKQYYEVFAQAVGRNLLDASKFWDLDPKSYESAEAYDAARQRIFDNAMSDLNEMMNPSMAPATGLLGYNVYTTPNGEQMFIPGTGTDLAGLHMNPNSTLGRLITGPNGQQYWIQPDNWINNAIRNSLRQEYNMSVSQATDKSSFYASVSYLNNEGIINNSGFERFTGRLNADIMAKPWLKVGANMLFSHYSSKYISDDGDGASSGNILAVANQIAPIYPLYIRDANKAIMKDQFGNTMYDYGDAKSPFGLVRPAYTQANPICENVLNVDKSNGNAFTATGFAEIRFLNDFKFTSNNTVNVDETRGNSVTNPFYGLYAAQNGIVAVEHSRYTNYNFQQLLNWTRQFDAHNVNVLLGHEAYRAESVNVYGTAHNMLLPSNEELSGTIQKDNNSSSKSNYNTEGYFSRVNYDYNGTYFASASFRRDATSRFHPKHRWGNFWSASAAWIISNEEFFQVPWVDILKAKASYGEQGNDNIGDFRYVNMYSIVNSNGVPAAVPSTMGNEKITWEKGGNFNSGVDFELFSSRLGGSVEYFYRKTTDMLFSFPLPPSYGYKSYYANVGDMANYGVEVDLHGDIIRTKDFTWSANANFTWYRNRIVRLPAQRRTLEVEGHGGYSSGNNFYAEGLPITTLYMKKWAGVDENTGKALWYKNEVTMTPKKDAEGNVIKDADGKEVMEKTTSVVTTDDYSQASNFLCGKALPDAYGGFGTSVNYKGFDFAVQFNYQIGGQVYDSSYAGLVGSQNADSKGGAIHKDVLKAWTQENHSTAMPRYYFNTADQYFAASSSRFLTDASYISLQQINAGYTLPEKLTKKIDIAKVRLYVAADNVALWSKRQGLDPRQSITGGSSNANYSPIRTVSGGINVQF